MLQVLINVHPQGDKTQMRLTAGVKIINDGTGTKTKGNYRYMLISKGKKIKQGRITGFPRRSQNALRLLHRVLDNAYREDG